MVFHNGFLLIAVIAPNIANIWPFSLGSCLSVYRIQIYVPLRLLAVVCAFFSFTVVKHARSSGFWSYIFPNGFQLLLTCQIQGRNERLVQSEGREMRIT